MNEIKNILDMGGFIVPLVLLSVVVWAALSWVILSKRYQRSSLLIAKLEAQLAVLNAGSHGMGRKLLDLESRLHRLQASQNQLQHSNVDFSFTQAQRLMTEGLPNEAIAANSGLSSSEINLMRLLHSQTSKLAEHA